MGNVVNKPETMLEKAKREVREENEKKAVEIIKVKYREQLKAELIVSNLKEEIKILEERIKRGDLEEIEE